MLSYWISLSTKYAHLHLPWRSRCCNNGVLLRIGRWHQVLEVCYYNDSITTVASDEIRKARKELEYLVWPLPNVEQNKRDINKLLVLIMKQNLEVYVNLRNLEVYLRAQYDIPYRYTQWTARDYVWDSTWGSNRKCDPKANLLITERFVKALITFNNKHTYRANQYSRVQPH